MTIDIAFVRMPAASALGWIEKNAEQFRSLVREELDEGEARKLMKQLGIKRADIQGIGIEEESLDETLAGLGTSGKLNELVTMPPATVKNVGKMPPVLEDEKDVRRLFAAAAKNGDHVVIMIGDVFGG